jgi:hypothetical protein
MKANESKSIHVTFTTRRVTCSPVHINSEQLHQEGDIKYLGLHLDRRLTRHKHIFAKRKQLGLILTEIYWLLRRKSNTLQATNFSYIKNTEINMDLRNTTLGYGFHFQHRNSRTFPIESLAHDNPPLQLSIQSSPQLTYK